MKKEKRRTRASAADSNLRLDAISGSKNPEVRAFYAQAHEEEFSRYYDWLDQHSSADGRTLLVPAKEAAEEFQRAMERVHARAGYRYIHLLSPVMQKRLRDVYPLPPSPGGGNASSLGMTG
ncbi:MAG: hypothetical protein LBB66_04360 [Desulfovibrio sp.]|jgi:hypothetical protein|nr:hypothetical protein [Desulfovibrio sp.]